MHKTYSWSPVYQIKKKRDQLLLESLKNNAEEVVETKFYTKNILWFFKEKISSYNPIRETYRIIRKSERDTTKGICVRFFHTLSFFLQKFYLASLKFLYSSKRVLAFELIDLLVDCAFCFLYFVEFAYNTNPHDPIADIPGIPYFLTVYRPQLIFHIAIYLSIWNVGSLFVRFLYVFTFTHY